MPVQHENKETPDGDYIKITYGEINHEKEYIIQAVVRNEFGHTFENTSQSWKAKLGDLLKEWGIMDRKSRIEISPPFGVERSEITDEYVKEAIYTLLAEENGKYSSVQFIDCNVQSKNLHSSPQQ